MFKYELKYNMIFGYLFLGVVFYLSEINWNLFYLSYFAFAALGVGLGFHRILGHGLVVDKPLRWFSVWLGVLAHLGAPKGAAMWHVNHHKNADTEHDQVKAWKSALMPRVNKLNVGREELRKVFSGLEGDKFFELIDDHFYLVFLISYAVIFFALGWKSTFIYVVAPASLALTIHSLSTIYLHSHGYRNFETKDKSKNTILWWPVLFGENWHNNHHYNSYDPNQSHHWYEIDLIYLIAKPFTRSMYRW